MKARYYSGLTLFALLAPMPAITLAQAVVSTAAQENDISRLVETRSTKPKMRACDNRSKPDACFRVMLEMTPVDATPVGIAARERSVSAYTSNGSLCGGYPVSGVNRLEAFNIPNGRWNLDRLTYAQNNKPLIAVFDFECDGSISDIEEVTIQLSFDFHLNGRTNGQARYVFRRLELSR